MNLRIGAAIFAVAVTAGTAGAAPSPTQPSQYQRDKHATLENSAPADEYFGKLKMSYLGMNNTFRDATISSGDHTTDPAIVSKLAFAEDALSDWEHKYPHDPELPRTYYLAIQADQRVWIKTNQDLAWQYMNRIVSVFPATYFGKLVKKNLDIGFTEHYYAPAVPCTTPLPGDASPAPERTPTATPGPTQTVLAKNHRVQIEITACIPTPSPAPVPTPSDSPTPEVTATPTASPTPTSAPAPRSRRRSRATPTPIPTPTPTSAATATPAPSPAPSAVATP